MREREKKRNWIQFEAMGNYLDVIMRIPIAIIDNNSIRRGEINAEAPGACAADGRESVESCNF